MEMKRFTRELEARAALAAPSPFPLEKYDFCVHCRQPLAKSRREFCYITKEDFLCQLCHEMYNAVSTRRHFVEAQLLYLEQTGRC